MMINMQYKIIGLCLVLLFGCSRLSKEKKLVVKYEKGDISLIRVNYGGKKEYLFLTSDIEAISSTDPIAMLDWSFDDFL